MRLLVLCHGTIDTPSTRLRILQYLPRLQKQGVVSLALMPPWWGKGRAAFWYIFTYVLRFMWLIVFWRPHVVFLQKRLLPLPLLKFIRFMQVRVVFDFDDAIYLRHAEEQTKSTPVMRSSQELLRLAVNLSQADLVIAGNEHLAGFARTYQSNIAILPTPVDTSAYSPAPCRSKPEATDERLVMGWIGTAANLWYLQQIAPVLQELTARYPGLIVKNVSDSKLEMPGVNILNKRWALSDEVQELCTFDVGIMPLTEDEWSRGKCAFKILLYLAMGIPVVCSPVAMNRAVIQDRVNGLLASTPEEWLQALDNLVQNADLRRKLGQAGYRTVQEKYALSVLAPQLYLLLTALRSSEADEAQMTE